MFTPVARARGMPARPVHRAGAVHAAQPTRRSPGSPGATRLRPFSPPSVRRVCSTSSFFSAFVMRRAFGAAGCWPLPNSLTCSGSPEGLAGSCACPFVFSRGLVSPFSPGGATRVVRRGLGGLIPAAESDGVPLSSRGTMEARREVEVLAGGRMLCDVGPPEFDRGTHRPGDKCPVRILLGNVGLFERHRIQVVDTALQTPTHPGDMPHQVAEPQAGYGDQSRR